MEELIKILKKIKPEIDFENATAYVDSGYLDSLDIFAIILEIEEQFSIEIAPSQIDPDNFQTIESIWKLIQEIRNKG